ncbi:toll/interleukin-1 receptor domain-containing protein [Pontibacter burrus]|uniref:Toll/interleukin-1 receptor domain-containing protein n=1 Tax=Pontibacter burrus TaxID=2704466 RepID=A0A6B3LR37_9BACT|nr:toll/interleukin-1 receptor domain-containing protein [Pontibacter burrus]NEM99289.1 toll/interleukin-1 receptor domain-containing protein [Pontibacter burrus]
MAKLYISYQHTDVQIVRSITEELRQRGHEILMDDSVLKVGQDWRKALLQSLKEADGVLVLITEKSLESKYVVSEIGTARAYVAESSNKKFIIPVIYGAIPIPSFIEDLYCIRLDPINFSQAIDKIDNSISSFLGKKEAEKENENQERQQIEIKAGDYIKDATNALNKRELHNRWIAYLCYIIGFITLIWGIQVGIQGFKAITDIQSLLEEYPNQVWGIYILSILKSTIIIGLLIAGSKYTFTLGKSFMHEALRNADRIHAISFGEFYLKAYGDKVDSHNDVKEVFQHWNIDKPSSFSGIESQSYDPKFSESLLEVIKTLSNKVKNNE